MKRILIINDLSMVGHASLMINIPLLSAKGYQVIPLVTTMLSHHSGFKDYLRIDHNDDFSRFATQLIHTNEKIDAILIGYLASASQVDSIIQLIHANPDALVFLDPVCADQGKLYSGMTQSHVDGLKRLLPLANYIKPNFTECLALLDKPLDTKPSLALIQQIFNQFKLITKAKVILTGVIDDSIIKNYFLKKNQLMVQQHPLIPHYIPGTGDIFDSIVIAELLSGRSLLYSINHASSFVIKCIDSIKDKPSDQLMYGCNIESMIRLK